MRREASVQGQGAIRPEAEVHNQSFQCREVESVMRLAARCMKAGPHQVFGDSRVH